MKQVLVRVGGSQGVDAANALQQADRVLRVEVPHKYGSCQTDPQSGYRSGRDGDDQVISTSSYHYGANEDGRTGGI
jgi:hypothetical protein